MNDEQLGFKGCFQKAIAIFFDAYPSYLLLAACAAVLISAYSAFLIQTTRSLPPAPLPGLALREIGVGLLGFLGGLVSVAFGGAAAVFTAAQVQQQPISWPQAYERTLRRYPALLAVSIVAGVLLAVGFALLVVPGILVAVYLGLGTETLLLEPCGVFHALRRSFELVRARGFWRTLWVLLVAGAAVALITSVIQFVFGGGGELLTLILGGFRAPPPPPSLLWQTVGSFLGVTLVGAFPAVVATVLYFDAGLRERRAAQD